MILFFTIFISFVIYVSGLAGYSIIDSNISGFDLTDFSLNPFTAFSVFIALMFVNPIYSVLGIMLFLPYSLTISFIGLKWLRGTG